MAPHVTTLMHLTPQWLRWATVETQGSSVRLVGRGQIDGSVPTSLEAWSEAGPANPGRLVIYDGRPRYYGFAFPAPSGRAASLDEAIRLRIRHELGADEQDLCWSVVRRHGTKAQGGPQVSVVLVRREALREINGWLERREGGTGQDWIGPDRVALATLLESPLFAGSVALANGDSQAVTVYFRDEAGQVLRDRIKLERLSEPGVLPNINESAARSVQWVWFGASEARKVFEKLTQGGSITLAPPPRVAAAREGLVSVMDDLKDFDPVILGALLLPGFHPAGMNSFLAPVAAPAPWTVWAQRINVKQMGTITAGLFVLMLASLWIGGHIRTAEASKVITQARRLQPAMTRLEATQGLLDRVRIESAPLTPVLAALMEAAEGDVMLQSLKIGENGQLQLAGTAQNDASPTKLAEGMDKSKLLSAVALQDVKANPKGGGFTFQLNARVEGRAKK